MFFVKYLDILNSLQFVFVATVPAFVLKLCFFIILLKRSADFIRIEKYFYLLLAIVLGSMFSDFAWLTKIISKLFLPAFDFRIVFLIIRLAWVLFIIQYQALALFIENLVEQKYALPLRQRFFCLISGIFCVIFLMIAIFDYDCVDFKDRFYLEPFFQDLSVVYVLFPLILPSVFLVLQRIKGEGIPSLLKKQIAILMKGFIIPLLVADFIQMCPFKLRPLEAFAHNYIAVGFTTIALTLAIYFCARKIFCLRFLNIKNYVQQPMNINFINDFKGALEQLGSVANFRELNHVVQQFFKETFFIMAGKTRLYLRQQDKHGSTNKLSQEEQESVIALVEAFLATHAKVIEPILKEEKIFIYDEIEFTHFYDMCETSTIILQFLRAIDADIFLPIYEQGKLIGYVIVERYSRPGNFYNSVESDEFIVFGSYLGNIINLLQNKRLDLLIEQEQYLRNELYQKHQEVNQYKESIRSFVRKSKVSQVGILFYKNRHFVYGNQAAKELISLNVNTQQGHPMVQALWRIAQHVESFKSPQSAIVKDAASESNLVISAVPHLVQNNVIVTVSLPDISDTLRYYIDSLRDSSEWDYLLYLQTTQSGKLVNKLIPGAGPSFLNFKIELLKLALGNKAILLTMADQDLRSVAEIIHHISLREILHTITLQGPSHDFDTAIALFGMNPIFGIEARERQALLEKLHSVGTLFIKNIHFLDLETQESLALFIRYGYYTIFKSDQKMVSDVRIICSSNQNLSLLAQEGKFSKALLNELKATSLSMPSLIALPEDELQQLTDGFIEQALSSDVLQHMLTLTEKEKNSLVINRPVSLQDLKMRVQQLLVKKSQKNLVYQEIPFNTDYDTSDPDLIAAARLGKQALKDSKTMIFLWNKFNKNQNKISAFLGVNRSSVNRRCKEYNLL
jgi:transcriptional regulator with GAF, ATPase, and Fis domain